MRPIPYTLGVLLLLSWTLPAQAQGLEPVKWSFDSRKIAEGEYELSFTARIDPGWYLYSQFLDNDLGPVPTTIVFDQPEQVELLGKAAESGGRIEQFDPVFEMQLVKFKTEAVFTQRIRFAGKPASLTGYVEFMCCDNEKCLPPREAPFRFEW